MILGPPEDEVEKTWVFILDCFLQIIYIFWNELYFEHCRSWIIVTNVETLVVSALVITVLYFLVGCDYSKLKLVRVVSRETNVGGFAETETIFSQPF